MKHDVHRQEEACVTCEKGLIRIVNDSEVLCLPVDSIKIVAECVDTGVLYPNSDVFVILVESSLSSVWVPDDTHGFGEMIRYLEDQFRCRLEPELYGSVGQVTRIMWPAPLVGKPLFVFKPYGRSWWERLLHPLTVERRLTEEVELWLRSHEPPEE